MIGSANRSAKKNRQNKMGKVCAKRAQIHGIMILRNGGESQKNIRFKEPLIQHFMVVTPLPTIRDQRTLTGWVTPATENNSPASAGLFI